MADEAAHRRHLAVPHAAEHDPLTDLYNQERFFRSALKLLQEQNDREFAMVCFSVDRFQILRSMSGDDFLIILIGCSQKKAREKAAEFSEASSKIPYSIHDGGYVRLRIGVASNEHFDQKSETLKKMIDNALTEMNQVLT